MSVKKTALFVSLALVASFPLFPQVAIDTAISNAARDISARVPQGSRIAVINMTSDHVALSDHVINELIFNLVRAGSFQVVPRGTVELEMASQEFDFQMAGWVSDENQQRLGHFLEANTIVTGSINRETANTYRLIVNAIHLESFTFQTVYGTSVRLDRQVRTLIAIGGGTFFEDFTTGQRVGMGALNMLFGTGSIINGQRLGWGVAGGQVVGLSFLIYGLVNPFYVWDPDLNSRGGYVEREEFQRFFIGVGTAIVGASILFGYIIPFFHTRPNPAVASTGNGIPFDFELVSSNDGNINGLRVLHSIRF